MPTQGVTNFLLVPPFFSTNDPNQLGENLVATTNWANSTPFLAMFGVSNQLAGTAPSTRQTPTQTFLVQCGTDTINFDAFGRGTITFPRAFPNSVVAMSVICGIDEVYVSLLAPVTTASADLNATNTPVGAPTEKASGIISITWLAIGW